MSFMKKKMDFMTKAKLIYSCELAIFAVIFLVLAILKFTGVIGVNATRLKVFNWITLFGGSWIVVDFFWAMFDKKRQKRIAVIDKCIHLPAGLYLIAFDLYCLIAQPSIDSDIVKLGVPIVLSYLALCYTFEAIYHFKYPVPGLLDVEEKANQQVVDEQDPVIVDDNKEIPSEEEEEKKDE